MHKYLQVIVIIVLIQDSILGLIVLISKASSEPPSLECLSHPQSPQHFAHISSITFTLKGYEMPLHLRPSGFWRLHLWQESSLVALLLPQESRWQCLHSLLNEGLWVVLLSSLCICLPMWVSAFL